MPGGIVPLPYGGSRGVSTDCDPAGRGMVKPPTTADAATRNPRREILGATLEFGMSVSPQEHKEYSFLCCRGFVGGFGPDRVAAMKRLLLLLTLATASATPALAQLAAPNSVGAAIGHLHINAADVDVQSKF